MYKLKAPLLAMLLLAGQALAAESGTALKNDTLRREPFADAAATGTLARGEGLVAHARSAEYRVPKP